jgi:hypothetical protein
LASTLQKLLANENRMSFFMPQNEPRNQAKTNLKNTESKSQILEQGNYTPIPNKLRQAWRKGIISRGCYDLVCELLEHSETFWPKDSYLMSLFSNRNYFKKATQECIDRNLIMVEKTRQGRSFVKVWTVLQPDVWNLDSTVQISTVENSTVQISTVQIRTPLTRRSSNKTKVNKKNLNKNDDEEQRSHKGASSSLGEVSSPSYEIVSLSKRLERFYVTIKGNPGAYDWVKANKASEALLELGGEYVEKFIDHLERNYAGTKFYVSELMWNDLLSEVDRAKVFVPEVRCDYSEEVKTDGIDSTPF